MHEGRVFQPGRAGVPHPSLIHHPQELSEFESTVEAVETVASAIAAPLDKKPSDRTRRDIKKLVPLISQIKAYEGLATPVLEFLASYAHMEVVWDTVELPRHTSEWACVC